MSCCCWSIRTPTRSVAGVTRVRCSHRRSISLSSGRRWWKWTGAGWRRITGRANWWGTPFSICGPGAVRSTVTCATSKRRSSARCESAAYRRSVSRRKRACGWTTARSPPSACASARWISSHGFALNVTTDLSYFSHIVPCGMPAVTMTSVARESSVLRESSVAQEPSVAREISAVEENGAADMAVLRARVAHHLAEVFALRYVDEPPAALRELLGAPVDDGVAALR